MKPAANIRNSKSAGPASRPFILAVVSILCLGILGSALFTFATLSRMRKLYLSNRGHSIASSIEAQARGPGRRNNPAFWQSLFEEACESHSDSVAYLALVDQNGRILASSSGSRLAPSKMESTGGGDIYVFEESLSQPRNLRNESSPAVAGWRVRIGLYTADANFIRQQAFLQLAISCLTILVLFALSVYLLRMIRRYLEVKAREGAEAQLKSLGIMAASLAHEIRNPLGAMKGLTQLAKEDLPPNHEAQKHLHTVVSEAERLERLVTDLLDFARPQKPQISEFDIADLLSDVKTMLQSKLESAKVAVQFSVKPGPLVVQSDPRGLRQVLLNVLINAVDVSPSGSEVALRIVRGEGNRSIVIQVDDAGPGLGERDPDDLFQPFVTTKVRGTGLGLAISRRIVESLRGSLTLENRAQGGARCSIRLPLPVE